MSKIIARRVVRAEDIDKYETLARELVENHAMLVGKEEDLAQLRNLLAGTEKPAPDNSGFGIVNVDQRLKLNFGEEYGLSIESVYGEGTTITVHTPGLLPQERTLS